MPKATQEEVVAEHHVPKLSPPPFPPGNLLWGQGPILVTFNALPHPGFVDGEHVSIFSEASAALLHPRAGKLISEILGLLRKMGGQAMAYSG